MKYKKIDDYNRYSVSDTGLVRNDKTGRILKGANSKGYPMVSLYKSGKYKKFAIHRLVGKAFIDNPENKPTINHKNGFKDDNRVENLEWMTYSENLQHAYDTELSVAKGEHNGQSKLTEKDILEIRAIKGKTQRSIAAQYGVKENTIWAIINRRNWKHI